MYFRKLAAHLSVSAKDLGTGKEQSIRITASSGLSEAEIERMKKDAELHADEDKKRKELVEARNNADSMIHMTTKTLQELGDKVDAATKGNVEQEIEKLKKTMEGEDTAAIKSATESLTQASHKLAEMMYAQASQQGAGAAGGGAAGAGAGAGASQGAGKGKDDDDVVDADFEEVK